MSWSRRLAITAAPRSVAALGGCGCRARRARLQRFAPLALALALVGCFQPLYGEASHPGLVEDIRAIEVAPIKDRIGHYLGDDLITALNGTGSAPTPKYRLAVTVTLKTATPTVESQISAADSATLIANAVYVLTKVEGGQKVLSGSADAAAAYDRTTQRYADLRAGRDAEIRVALALAAEIALRLTADLAAQRQGA